jgi:hypothetical protein
MSGKYFSSSRLMQYYKKSHMSSIKHTSGMQGITSPLANVWQGMSGMRFFVVNTAFNVT